MKSSHPYTPRVIGALAVAVVIGVGGFLAINGATQKTSGLALKSSSTITAQTATTTPSTTSTPTAAMTPSTKTTYKDGDYNAMSTYDVPGGQNSLAVTLTVVGDKITNVKTTSTIDSRDSQRYVDSFNSTISSQVTGAPLSNAFVGRVGSASLTSSAFNDALQTIITHAKA